MIHLTLLAGLLVASRFGPIVHEPPPPVGHWDELARRLTKWRDELRVQVEREYAEECERDDRLRRSLDETDRLFAEANEQLRRAGVAPLPPSQERLELRRVLDAAHIARQKRIQEYRRMFQRIEAAPQPRPVQKG